MRGSNSVPVGPAGTGQEPTVGRSALGSVRPDIVLLMLDDLGDIDNRVLLRLPTIKRLFLDQGTRFTDYHGNDPLCCPGRAAVLTGQRTEHHGVRWNNALAFDPSTTIATELQDVGYHTIITGKYFNLTERAPGQDPARLGSRPDLLGSLLERPAVAGRCPDPERHGRARLHHGHHQPDRSPLGPASAAGSAVVRVPQSLRGPLRAGRGPPVVRVRAAVPGAAPSG